MNRALLFTIIGYASGSLLFAKYFGYLFAHKDVTCNSVDKNPGTYNAFLNGGVLCGTATVLGDIAKGFLPVFLYLLSPDPLARYGITLVLAAPVLGHAFPLFHRFRGGKGIAVSFGCLLGLLPNVYPVLILASLFIIFSVLIKISPHYYRTLVTYVLSGILMLFLCPEPAVLIGFLLISGIVLTKLFMSTDEKTMFKVDVKWKS